MAAPMSRKCKKRLLVSALAPPRVRFPLPVCGPHLTDDQMGFHVEQPQQFKCSDSISDAGRARDADDETLQPLHGKSISVTQGVSWNSRLAYLTPVK